MEALVQPLEGCCTISLFSGALRTGIDGLFDFFDSLRGQPVVARSVFFVPSQRHRPPRLQLHHRTHGCCRRLYSGTGTCC